MKHITAYYLVLLYVTVMFKPVIPVVTDLLQHTINECNHIATVHAKYGIHHVQSEVLKAERNGSNHDPVKNIEVAQVHLLVTIFHVESIFFADTDTYTSPDSKLCLFILPYPAPPPRM